MMATAHSPVPDMLFYGAGAALGGAVTVLCMILPQWVASAVLGVLSCAAWCYWGCDWFHKQLGRFNIST